MDLHNKCNTITLGLNEYVLNNSLGDFEHGPAILSHTIRAITEKLSVTEKQSITEKQFIAEKELSQERQSSPDSGK